MMHPRGGASCHCASGAPQGGACEDTGQGSTPAGRLTLTPVLPRGCVKVSSDHWDGNASGSPDHIHSSQGRTHTGRSLCGDRCAFLV